ncbi:MAG: 3-isopropylmalate dehydrogenase [Anaerovoracaceae bacterium]|jgi:3-isopropylmalate dehydrogenase
MRYNVTVVPGDGVGPDIIREAMNVLEALGSRFNHEFIFTEKLAGGAAIDAVGIPLPEDTIMECKRADAVLLGAVGGPKWDHLPGNLRPEKAILGLRKELNLFANLRPATMYKQLKAACPLKDSIIGDALDVMIVRELTSGIYFGEKGRKEEDKSAYDVLYYNEEEIRRLLKVGFEAALKRKGRAVIVDKANVLETSRLWREITEEVSKEYPGVEYSYMYVDNCAMQLIHNPGQFDVIITENMFGDILSDAASMITGSIGMLASASLGTGTLGLYEPIHGSAPDMAGQNKANPIATILSAAMMLRYSFGLMEEAQAIESAVEAVLDKGLRTLDIWTEGMILLGTREMGRSIVEEMYEK